MDGHQLQGRVCSPPPAIIGVLSSLTIVGEPSYPIIVGVSSVLSLNPTPIPPFRYGVSAVTVLPCTPLVPACPARHRAWSLPTTTTHRDPSDCHHSSRRWRTAAPAAATNVQGLRHGSPVNVPENRAAEARKTILRVSDRRIWPAAHVSEDLCDGAV